MLNDGNKSEILDDKRNSHRSSQKKVGGTMIKHKRCKERIKKRSFYHETRKL